MTFLYPDMYLDKVEEIPFKELYKKGFRGVLFDVDNTLVPFDQLDAHKSLEEYIKELENIGLVVALVSNNTRKRVESLNKGLKLPIMPMAMKPFGFKIKRMLKTLGIGKHETIFVGDQLFTDVWAGNGVGMYTILVKPIQKKEQWISRIKRKVEKIILKRYISKKGK
ncbi:MAG: YqeG family HAD IIIA-type phosphatase [Candidatus Izimaplasma sp.]|nr:YqeG family HAD IIIA-type phosphatase [Candidatus Izimaplasma bacterium]